MKAVIVSLFAVGLLAATASAPATAAEVVKVKVVNKHRVHYCKTWGWRNNPHDHYCRIWGWR